MSYAFEDYDAFLASFSEKDQMLQHNPSLSTTLSTDDDDGVFGSFYNSELQGDVQQLPPPNQLNANMILSPDYTSHSSSSSPYEMQQINTAGFQDYSFNNNVADAYPLNNGGTELTKQESFSDVSSSASPASMPNYSKTVNSIVNNTNAKPQKSTRLSDAVPHGGSISKNSQKKEKSSHNMIEKRYRTNINDKIHVLRDSVPALRVLVESGDDDGDDLDGLQPAKKLNKATIFTKATEYIKHLEAKNEFLRKENEELKTRIYGGQLTPGSSVSSYSGMSDSRHQQGMSLGNKVLLGGLACMVGSGLTDDFNNGDARSLFALPVFGFDAAGVQVMSKSLLIILKLGFVFAILLNFVFPSLFYSKGTKKGKAQSATTSKIYDDVREVSTASMLSTFSLKRGHSNNDYVKAAIFRCVVLKVRYFNANSMVKSIVGVYVDHLWTYLKDIQLDEDTPETNSLRTIFALDNAQTIHNEEYMIKLSKYDVTLLNSGDFDATVDQDYSVVSLLFQMVNESRTNMFLRKFMVDTVNTDKTIPEIETTLVPETDEYNVELITLFKPQEEQIEKFRHVLESWETSEIKQDDILVLFASIVQNLVYEKKDYVSAKKWFSRIDSAQFTDFGLLGFTSLYIIVLSMISTTETYTNDKEVIFKLEEISAILRIWLGNANGSVLNFKKRSQLIDFFVNVSLKIHGMESICDFDSNVLVSA